MDLPSTSSNTPQQPDTVPPSIQIDEFDESSVRLWKIFREAIQPLYFMILCWVNPTWARGSNFKDYLESQGVNINEVKGNLSKDQRDKFTNPTSHNTWDISMIHALLPFSKCLAGKNDEKWHKQNGSDPEMSLTILKNKRNETAHNPRIERGWCCLIIDELYELTIKIQEGLKLVVLGYVVNPEDKEEIEREMDRVFDNTRQKIHEIGKGGIGAEVFDEYQREINFTKKMNGLLLIKGMAGMGKTTLVKKIISDWLSKKDDIKGLNDFAILLNVECRDSIESFKDLCIAQRFKLFDKDTTIRDHTIDAYIALLRATDAPLPNREEIIIAIDLNDTDGLVELQRQLSRHLINPSWIHLNNHYYRDSEPTVEERESIKNLLTNE
ncbi:uncharacterized protein [Palaemon carinicauda]|uniref:uncharacterized protein n=1 Tax=Palaemon carinicauda TaxID=392227 RepID=UPI0035B695FE